MDPLFSSQLSVFLIAECYQSIGTQPLLSEDSTATLAAAVPSRERRREEKASRKVLSWS